MEKFFKTNEAAKFLGVSRSSITNWVKQGVLGSGVTPGGHYRFTKQELLEFAKERGLILPGQRVHDKNHPVRILLIEDDVNFRDFIKEILEDFSGYELKEASDGMAGALLIGTWKPDLIILDIRMPNMNGVEFLKMLRNNPETEHIRVIVVSAHLSEEVCNDINSLHVDIILEKPVRLGKIVAAIEKLTNLSLKM